MPNYQNSKIYKVWSPQTREIYVGSTTQPLSRRMTGHRSKYKMYKAGKHCYVSSFKILEFGDARIELICECPCDNKEQLRAIEGRYIRELNCCNKEIAGRDKKQYYIDNKNHINKRNQKWYINNKEKELAKCKQRYENNKEHILTKQKEYYESKKLLILEKQKKHYEANKDKMNSKVQCECGCFVNKRGISRHKRSAKHQRLMKAKA